MCSRDVPPTEYRDAEKRGDDRRKRECKPVSRAGGFQDLPAVICVVEGSGDPDEQADYEQNPASYAFIDASTAICCTGWYTFNVPLGTLNATEKKTRSGKTSGAMPCRVRESGNHRSKPRPVGDQRRNQQADAGALLCGSREHRRGGDGAS